MSLVLRPAAADDVEFPTEMLIEAINWRPGRLFSRERGYSGISLTVERDNPALALYRAEGLSPVRTAGNANIMRPPRDDQTATDG